MEAGFGIGPIANLAQLPDRVEACGRRQPTEPVLTDKLTQNVGCNIDIPGLRIETTSYDAESSKFLTLVFLVQTHTQTVLS
jgi:hypothetical protein